MEFALSAPSHKEPKKNYKSGSAARGYRAVTPLGWAPALLPPRKTALAARGGEAAQRGQEVGAARPGSRDSGTTGEGVWAHPGTSPTMRGHVAYPSLAILICAMGMVTPVAAREGRISRRGGGAGGRSQDGWG